MSIKKSRKPAGIKISKKDLIDWLKSSAKSANDQAEKIVLPISLAELIELIEALPDEKPKLDDAEKARLVLEMYSQPEIHRQTGIPFSSVNQLVNHTRELTKSRWETVKKLALMYDAENNRKEKLTEIISELSENELLMVERIIAAVKEHPGKV
ncbi:MAG: hypothetical protein LKJ03_04180 [Enterococcaceae bacterium]|nr:hypothetical protein [Enterococcaceae bacterium]MCI1918851.1 hypothetical protein [Enterococcaceae bacterium]